MNHPKQILSILAIGLFTLGAAGVAFGDDDDNDRRGKQNERSQTRADFAPATNAAYGEECGSCHMAYQPGLLPVRAWEAIMTPEALGNHYGDDASLTDALRNEIGAYLTANAADQSSGKRARKFAEASVVGADGGLPRITGNSYFLKKHDEIPAKMVKDNPEVGSFSQCNRCHQSAADGIYDEDQIRIPGFGRWED